MPVKGTSLTHPGATRLYPPPADLLSPDEIYTDLALPDASTGDRPFVAINMVSTLDGKAAIDGKASPIGSSVDRRLMRNIRSAFDAVLVGAGTLREEEVDLGVPEELAEKRIEEGLSRQPLGGVLTGSGRIPTERRLFRSASTVPLVVIASAGSSEEGLLEASAQGAEVIQTPGEGLPEPREVIKALRKVFGVRRILLEGGPSVNHSFLSCGLVDEIFLTLAPKLTGGEDPAILEGRALPNPPKPRLLSAYLYRDELFLRYAVGDAAESISDK